MEQVRQAAAQGRLRGTAQDFVEQQVGVGAEFLEQRFLCFDRLFQECVIHIFLWPAVKKRWYFARACGSYDPFPGCTAEARACEDLELCFNDLSTLQHSSRVSSRALLCLGVSRYTGRTLRTKHANGVKQGLELVPFRKVSCRLTE